jgi:hypothetical protein
MACARNRDPTDFSRFKVGIQYYLKSSLLLEHLWQAGNVSFYKAFSVHL